MNKTNIIIAVRDTDLRLSLDLLLRDEPYLNVVGTATTLESTQGLISAESQAFVLLEWGLGERPMEDVLKDFKDSKPDTKVILLGNHSIQEQLALRIGADAFLQIGSSPEGLRFTIKNLISNENEFETAQVKK